MAVHLIRDIFAYADRFQNSVFVIQIDYDVIAHPSFPVVLQDLVLLHQIGIKIVLVPGAKRHIDNVLDRYGIECPFVNGVRISSSDSIPFIKMAAFDTANRIMTLMSRHHVTGIIGNWVRARALGVVDGIDYESTGRVDRISIESVSAVLKDGFIPIFPCIGWSAAGSPYNISSPELASRLSVDLKAAKLFFLTSSDVLTRETFVIPDGIHLDEDGRISRLYPEQGELLLQSNPDCEQYFRSILRCSVEACRGGVERAHIVDGRRDGVILEEVFTNQGVGTMIHKSPFESLRPMNDEDVPAVIRLMQPAMEKGILVHRSADDLLQRISDYVVFSADGQIVGCGALHRWADTVGEIAALATDSQKAYAGVGEQIMLYLLNEARKKGLQEVFVLTTQAFDWFSRHGFTTGSVDDLPEERRLRYNPQRKSRILIKNIEAQEK
ncbi:amino-acid N-acetyltransferase [Spirochaeta dissipatitropha]